MTTLAVTGEIERVTACLPAIDRPRQTPPRFRGSDGKKTRVTAVSYTVLLRGGIPLFHIGVQSEVHAPKEMTYV